MLLLQGPQAVIVGRVTAIAWPGQQALATALAEAAARTAPFPGIGPLPDRPFTIILAPTRARFDSLTHGRLPAWSVGMAAPGRGVIVLLNAQSFDQLRVALRHELAHLALHWRLGGRDPPLWFDEGYATLASGEWDRVDALRVNWELARGVHPGLDDVDEALRSDEAGAETAYALATTAVVLLQRWGQERGLAPLIDALATAPTFDAAVRVTYHVTEGDFETRWERDLDSRYGLLSWAASVGLFWTVLAVLLVVIVRARRRRDAERRARLDEGWVVPEDVDGDEPDA